MAKKKTVTKKIVKTKSKTRLAERTTIIPVTQQDDKSDRFKKKKLLTLADIPGFGYLQPRKKGGSK